MPKSTIWTCSRSSRHDDHHVVGLEIAVHEADTVRVLEAEQQLPGQLERALRGQRHRHDVGQRLAVRVREDHQVPAIGDRRADVDHAGDVLVREAGGEQRLAPKPRDELSGCRRAADAAP